jgi:hypothetical protein
LFCEHFVVLIYRLQTKREIMALINRTEFDGPNRKGEDVKAPLEAPLCFPTSLDKTTSEEEADLPNHNTQYVFLWINLGDADVKGRRTHNSSYRDIGRGVGVSVIDLDVLNANQRIDSGEGVEDRIHR